MTASIINKTIKSIVAASAALIMAASVAACGPNAATPSEENNASNGGATTSKVTARSLGRDQEVRRAQSGRLLRQGPVRLHRQGR